MSRIGFEAGKIRGYGVACEEPEIFRQSLWRLLLDIGYDALILFLLGEMRRPAHDGVADIRGKRQQGGDLTDTIALLQPIGSIGEPEPASLKQGTGRAQIR